MDQQIDGVEHIIVDGGSTDGTVEAIKSYSKSNSHVRWISEPDQGQSDAMNKGLALSTAPIISFLNADDFYEPEAFQYVLNWFEELPPNSILVGDCRIWDQVGGFTINRPAKLSYLNVVANRVFPMNPSSYFYHKTIHDVIGPYDVRDHYSMDVDFIIRATRIANIVYVPKVLGNFRYLPGTKTYEDVRTGMNRVRTNALFQKEFSKLSLLQKTYVIFFIKFWTPTVYILRRVAYYTKRPAEIPAFLKRAIGRQGA